MRLECTSPLHPLAGQYLMAYTDAAQQILSLPVFVQAMAGKELVIAPPVPADWLPGVEIMLRGPLGSGFHPPSTFKHLALADLSNHRGSRLLRLASELADRNIETVLLSDAAPEELPVEIEFLPLKSLNEVIAWSDYLALELPLSQMGLLHHLAGVSANTEFPASAEALIDTPMICGGMASCGVCSVRSNGHWLFACKDGPVFRLSQISGEE